MSFFQWLREGVRQAVVLGLADAVEDVGTRQSTEDFGPALAQSLRERLTVQKDSIKDATIVDQAASAPARRRLGRSLESLKAPAAKAA
jgi:hypothetical protein